MMFKLYMYFFYEIHNLNLQPPILLWILLQSCLAQVQSQFGQTPALSSFSFYYGSLLRAVCIIYLG